MAKFGAVPNLFRVLHNAPAALEAYVSFGVALARGTFDPRVHEQIVVTAAASNLCGYCLGAQNVIGGKLGLTQQELADATNAAAR